MGFFIGQVLKKCGTNTEPSLIKELIMEHIKKKLLIFIPKHKYNHYMVFTNIFAIVFYVALSLFTFVLSLSLREDYDNDFYWILSVINNTLFWPFYVTITVAYFLGEVLINLMKERLNK